MDIAKLEKLLDELESDLAERKESWSSSASTEICKAICAFSNDLPNHREPGYVFVGVKDNGQPVGIKDGEKALLDLSGVRAAGNILPMPVMNVELVTLKGTQVLAAEVWPCQEPPVRYKGVTWVRVGSSKARATQEEERRLSEKRLSGQLSFDRRPLVSASLGELDLEAFRQNYLPFAIAPEVLAENQRTVEEQLASLRFLSSATGPPTAAGILFTGKDPQFRLPGAYIQFLRVDGLELTDPIVDQQDLTGTLIQQLRQVDELLKAHIRTTTEIPDTGPEIRRPDYPIQALQQLIRNAVMHRNYESSHAPIKIYWYTDRIEISNPGGLYGHVTPDNYDRTTDYRNPEIAAALKTLGYVQRFGMGIQMARKAMQNNGNPLPEHQFYPEYIQVTLRSRGT